eukprot:TRINITY_DN4538_c2_g1_i1.p1 TRINITY_DN4538_c2_g1~~TRINITY_DN4538_c2_g1_i1.p1  ORF type:complete len:368 (+),score=63.32 TRINITY_DN4538_c2_g1_i1:129-1232(+)
MATLRKHANGVAQSAATLWRGGVRPDRGFYGYDPKNQLDFPSWYVQSHGEWFNAPTDKAALRDRLSGVRLKPGGYTAGKAKGKLAGWLLINRQGKLVTRNPYNGLLDDLGKLVSVRQCDASDGPGFNRGTLFCVTSQDGDETNTVYSSMQAMLPWTWQEHWHRQLMRSTWRRNVLDVWETLQSICKDNDPSYTPHELDHSRVPIIRYTHGHPSPPRWKLPIYPTARKPIDTYMTGWDESVWNWHPSPYGDPKLNPTVYPEFRTNRNTLDTHLDLMGRHPYDTVGTRGLSNNKEKFQHSSYSKHWNAEDPVSWHVVPRETAEQHSIWTYWENKYDMNRHNGVKGTHEGPWPVTHPFRDRPNTPIPLPP